ncbi:MAG TPA: PilZ domain-containing protein [Candidatus Acidoferrales bacterium]
MRHEKGRRTLNLPESANEKRGAPRYPLIASADVIEVETGASFSARTSDISRTGCYIDMLNPSPQGTQIRVIIKNSDDVFEATARVVFTVPGLGMGIAFLRVAPQHEAVLTKWIAELAV